jgi:hypothetical protein
MNQPETNFDPAQEPVLRGLQEQLRSLRTLLACVLVILLAISICLNVFLRRQAVAVTSQVSEIQKTLVQFQTSDSPRMTEFWTKLVGYSKTHSDFAPIIEKYSPHIVLPAQQSTNATPKK